jgi:hypothetical protein
VSSGSGGSTNTTAGNGGAAGGVAVGGQAGEGGEAGGQTDPEPKTPGTDCESALPVGEGSVTADTCELGAEIDASPDCYRFEPTRGPEAVFVFTPESSAFYMIVADAGQGPLIPVLTVTPPDSSCGTPGYDDFVGPWCSAVLGEEPELIYPLFLDAGTPYHIIVDGYASLGEPLVTTCGPFVLSIQRIEF